MSVFGCGCCDDISSSEKFRKLEKVVNSHSDKLEELENEISAFSIAPHVHGYPLNGERKKERWVVHTDEEFQVCMERMNRGNIDMRIFIDTPGNFYLNAFVVQNCCLHISARVGGVVITVGDDTQGSVAFYHCHLNIQGASDNEPITIRMKNTGYYMYWEGCTTLFQYINFACTCGSWGGYVAYRHCSFSNATEPDRAEGKRCVFGIGSTIILQGCHFTDVRDKVTLIHLESCNVYVYTITSVDAPDKIQEVGYGFWAVRSTINLNAVMHMERRKCGMYAGNCILNINKGRMDALKEAVDGVQLEDCCNIWGVGMD